ncbi:MAG TPA: SHOCT domain-containing protein [Mycobacteriales bacterium]|nr:SHOCT domain-containing protein [Mycobacteriales bacterium]
MLGLGSRKSFTLLTVNRSDGQAFYFENPREIGHWRSRGRELLAERPALGRVLRIAGFSEPNGASLPGVADQLGRLAELNAQGALSDEEFAAAKAAVLQQQIR